MKSPAIIFGKGGLVISTGYCEAGPAIEIAPNGPHSLENVVYLVFPTAEHAERVAAAILQSSPSEHTL